MNVALYPYARIIKNVPRSDEAKIALRLADAVSIDVDSTAIQEESIDELAAYCGKGQEVARLTEIAMEPGSGLNFREALTERLDVIDPSFLQVVNFLRIHRPKLTPGVHSLVRTLRRLKKEVYLIADGFQCLVCPVAKRLRLPITNVRSNKLLFYLAGSYGGFDKTEATSESGGKSRVIRHLKREKGFKCVVHIGDGATDLDARPAADAVIGYGGNIVRGNVRAEAQWFVYDFKEIEDVL